MTADLARRILAAREKVTQAKTLVDLYTRAVAHANDELLTLLLDPDFERELTSPTLPNRTTAPKRSEEAVPTIQPGIRDAATGDFVTARTPASAQGA